MSRQLISLNDNNWQFGSVPQRPFSAVDLFDLPAVTRWLPATVPGNVRPDLLAQNLVPNPFTEKGYKASQWVETVDWWYRRVIQVDSLQPGQRAFLLLDGIDYLSAIFINGQEVARHEGMFSRQRVEVTEALFNGNGVAEIAVRLWGSAALPHRRLNWRQRVWQKIGSVVYRGWAGIYPNRSATLKCQMSFGWDFAPPIRAMGIWDEVHLLITEALFIEEVAVSSRQVAENDGWALSVDLAINAPHSLSVEARVVVEPANFAGPAFEPFPFLLHLPAGSSTLNLQCSLSRVALWQPWDRGFPHLYNVTVVLATAKKKTLDCVTHRIGFRTVKMRDRKLTLNGQSEFIRGLNWVPADSFPGKLRRDDYARLLHLAQAGGANLVRVWGGGLREKRAFYELCDELGLLVWQEFPFACMFLGSYPRDAAFLSLVVQECGAIVRQLRHHSSLILWCGGNEFSHLRNRPLLNTLSGVVRQLDGTRPFLPTSPGPGDAHNWHVWHGDAPFQAYQQETAPFLSEFGLQALPTNNDDFTGNNLSAHYADVPKLMRYASLFNRQLKIDSSQLTSDSSQLAQAVGLQTAIEHMRRRKGEAGGLCIWQFNEPWPAVSWAIVDYFGRPKLACQKLSTWYNPVLVSLKFPVGQKWHAGNTFTAEIWVINDSQKSYAPCTLKISLVQAFSAASMSIYQTEIPSLAANSIRRVGQLTHQFTAKPHAINLSLHRGDDLLSQNSYPLNWHDPSRGSLALRFRRWVAHWVLR